MGMGWSNDGGRINGRERERRREERKNMSGYKKKKSNRSRGSEAGRRKGRYSDRRIRESCVEDVAIKVRPERSGEEGHVDLWGKRVASAKALRQSLPRVFED